MIRSILITLLAFAGAAHADPSRMARDARAHFDRGTSLYKSGDYAGAVAEFEAGRAIEAHPDFDYTLGQAYRRLGDCKRANEHYRAYLASGPSDAAAAFARANLTRCPQERSHTPVPSTATTPTMESSEPTASEPPVSEPPAREPTPVKRAPALAEPWGPDASSIAPAREPDREASLPPGRDRTAPAWYRDVPGGALAIAGISGLAVGATYLVLADRDVAAANAAKPISRLEELSATAHRERTIGTIGLVAGGALAITAAVRYALVARAGQPLPDRGAMITVGHDGVYAGWTGRF